MLVNLTDVFTTEGKTKTMEVPIEMETFKSYGVDYSIVEKTPVSFTFTYGSANRAKVCGKAEVVLDMQCDRCLKPVSVKVILDFEREVSPRTEEIGEISEEDDLDLMEGYSLDTEILIYNELLMNQPEKVLCKDDCKGICKVCGHDLNDGECGCDTFVPDPRMAVLQDIFNANKEV
ncbi:MAG: DUF177 domain-containing protein [Lachnospiraceae bacterium]|nr:DUF177 domain-containing protein [Lachnospiraceae bacterium]